MNKNITFKFMKVPSSTDKSLLEQRISTAAVNIFTLNHFKLK